MALVALLLTMVLTIGESQSLWPSKNIQQRRCYSCRSKHFQTYFWNRLLTSISWDRSRGPLGDCGDEFVTYNHSSQVGDNCKQIQICQKIWNYLRLLKNPVHQDGVSNKRRDKTQRFLFKKPHLDLDNCNAWRGQKSFSIKLTDPGWDGNRSKLPGEETKRLKGEMCRGVKPMFKLKMDSILMSKVGLRQSW